MFPSTTTAVAGSNPGVAKPTVGLHTGIGAGTLTKGLGASGKTLLHMVPIHAVEHLVLVVGAVGLLWVVAFVVGLRKGPVKR